jgi:hypothetical protein
MSQRPPITSYLPPVLIVWASLLFLAAQIVCGTEPTFAMAATATFVLAGMTYNTLGGINTPNGVCYSLLAFGYVFFPFTFKLVLGQATDSHLRSPYETIGVLILGLLGTFLAASLSRSIGPRSGHFNFADPSTFRQTANRLSLVGIGLLAISFSFPAVASMPIFETIFSVTQDFLVFAFVCETAHLITSSKGRRGIGWRNSLMFAVLWAQAFLALSRQGIFTPLVLFCLVARSFGYRPVRREIGAIAAVGLSALAVLPFTALGHTFLLEQYGRYGGSQFEMLEGFIEDISFNRDNLFQMIDAVQQVRNEREPTYFGKPLNVPDRFSRMGEVDAIVDDSTRHGPRGIEYLFDGVTILPKSISGIAVADGAQNYLARRAGILSPYDLGTGISFGIYADTYANVSWLFLLPLIVLMHGTMFIVSDMLVSTCRRNLASIILIGSLFHGFSESNASYIPYFLTRQIPMIVIVLMALNGRIPFLRSASRRSQLERQVV